MTKKKVDDLYFQLFCEKNSDGTKHLRLRGKELYQRFGKRLGPNEMPALASFLNKNPEITSLDLAYNDLQDEGIKILAEEFFDRPNNIVNINLLHCDLHAEGLKRLSSAKHLNFQIIRLIGNKLGAEGARYIGTILENCPDLKNLDIGETDQTLESIESLLMMIEKSQLKSINISRIIPNSYYSKYNNSTLADDLGVLLKLNTSLEELRVQKCEFDGHDVELLLGGLKVHINLKMLDLTANKIGDDGVLILCHWLKTRPSLMALQISANDITIVGGQALGLVLPFTRIRLLDLHNNKIQDKGLAEIFDTIKKSTQMRYLYIWGNYLGPITLAKIEKLLESGVLEQNNIDVKVYYVDGKRYGAYYPTNQFTQRCYSIMEYGCPPELKIKRNKIRHPYAQPRVLIDFNFFDQYPPVDESLGFKVPFAALEDL
ncbi:unnamed protein product [Ceutorhynchus assimilis]|uniref:Leucine rich repeat containing 34 n=1 Tax=Ceutorhynchus assimilis TaxID=467358 RepID=A0A9N9QR42_9CUCU|nr:unnamed protein product [Ceutorhynchus assimilis]